MTDATPDGKPSFGNWLATNRERRGLSQRALAAKAGVSSAMVSKLESDLVGTTPDTVRLLADAMDVSRADAIRAWVESLEEGLVYEPDPDSMPIPEGFRDLTPEDQEAARASFEATVEALRKVRAATGVIGHNRDRYRQETESTELVDLAKMVEDAEAAEEGASPGYIPRRTGKRTRARDEGDSEGTGSQ